MISKKTQMQERSALQPQKAAKPNPLRKKTKWLVLLLVIVLAAGIGLRTLRPGNKEEEITYQTSTVTRRTITQSLSGSGTLQPAETYTVTTLASGEVLSDTFEEGDLVEKGQLLYTLDSSDVDSSQAHEDYANALESIYPSAKISGRISEVYVKEGQDVSANTQICKIVTDDKVTIDFYFSYVDPENFYIGQQATVFVSGYDGSTPGVVDRISSDTTTVNGRKMAVVRVRLTNPGLFTSSDTAKAVIGSYSSYGDSTINVGTSSIVTAGTAGTITNLSIITGDTVTKGQRLCTLTGDSVNTMLENARKKLDNIQDKLEDYQITAPVSGTVVNKVAKAGDNVSSSTLCVIYDLSHLEMTLNIDELDISLIEVGQQVMVTAAAVEGRTYSGVVTRVSVVGSTSGGTTTYPVTVRIDETDGLLPGMNVDAVITLSESQNVISIPNGAVNRGNTVMITKESPSATNALEQEVPDGYVYVSIITGLSDDNYIEILSGLQEGDTVAYLRTSSSNNMMGMMGMPGGMMGMPSGGMPSGMPSGGMSGGMPGGMPSGGARPSGGGFPG